MNWHMESIKTNPLFDSPGIVNDPMLLYPPFREKIRRLIVIAVESGLQVVLFESYRSQRRQLALFKQRKTKLKTNGMHFYGVAADVVFRTVGGGWTWTPAPGGAGGAMWKRLGQIGKDLGLVWGGDWKGLVDCPHFQLTSVAEQSEIVAGNYPPAVADKLETEYDIPTRQVALDARRSIVRQLAAVYQIVLDPKSQISKDSLARLNT